MSDSRQKRTPTAARSDGTGLDHCPVPGQSTGVAGVVLEGFIEDSAIDKAALHLRRIQGTREPRQKTE